MSFIDDPTQIYLSKSQGAAPPQGKFYAADANLIRQDLLELRAALTGILNAYTPPAFCEVELKPLTDPIWQSIPYPPTIPVVSGALSDLAGVPVFQSMEQDVFGNASGNMPVAGLVTIGPSGTGVYRMLLQADGFSDTVGNIIVVIKINGTGSLELSGTVNYNPSLAGSPDQITLGGFKLLHPGDVISAHVTADHNSLISLTSYSMQVNRLGGSSK